MCALVVFLSFSRQSRENYFNPLRHDFFCLKLEAVHSIQAVYCPSDKQGARVPLQETIRHRNGKRYPFQVQVWAFEAKITLGIIVCVRI